MMYWLLKNLFGWLIKLIWIKKVEGLENLPKTGPCIVVANHSSYFDFISLAAILPRRVYFLAGEVFFRKWWWRPLVKMTGQIKVDRNAKDKTETKQKVFKILEKGEVFGIFPEGTRSPDGKMGKTFTGVAEFALKAKAPVVPVGIAGSFEVMSRRDKLPKFKKNIIIKVGKPVYFEKFYGKEGDKLILRNITDEIISEILKSLN